MGIAIPDWADLRSDLQDEFTPRLATDPSQAWNSWDMDRRLRVLDIMAVLRRYQIWPYIQTIFWGTLVRENRWGRKNDRVTFTADGGWWLGVTTKDGVEAALDAAGFENRINLNHIENQTNYMEPGDGTVMHWGRLVAPYDQYSTLHFDSGGGRIWSREHFHEFLSGAGLSTEEVTGAIGRSPAGYYLRGICAELDKLLLDGEIDQFLGT
jgi:hypothetical protein